MSTIGYITTLSFLLRLNFSMNHICDESSNPCNWNCNSNTQCANDTFACNSSSGCILNCATSSSCSHATVHQYGSGIMNIICNDSSSCNDINITRHNGYIYLLCHSHNDLCSHLNIHCATNHTHCFQSHTNSTIQSNENNSNQNDHIPFHQTVLSQLSLIPFLALSSLILLCFAFNLMFCCWCLCRRKYIKHNKVIHVPNNQCIESLKQPNHTQNNYYCNDEDAQYTETLKEPHEAYVVSLKPPHDYNAYNKDYSDDNECSDEDVEEHNDLANAPCLDLRELDDDTEDIAVTMRGEDADITFWGELPQSPKKQDNITEDTHDFKDSDAEDAKEMDDTKTSPQELDEDTVPNISNNDTKLPIPNDKNDTEFELLNSKKSPFEHSIISPRNISDQSTEIGRFMVQDNAGNEVINEGKAHNFVENDEEQVLSKLSAKSVDNKKGNANSRRLKQKSREMMSVVNEMNDMKRTSGIDSEIIKFNVNGNTMNGNVNSLKPMKEDRADKSNYIHTFRGNLRFINDGEQGRQIETDPTLRNTTNKENKINFAMLFSSPKSNSPSISPRNITAISPRKIIDNIIKSSISPRTRNHELLLFENDDDDDEEEEDGGGSIDAVHMKQDVLDYSHDVHRNDELQLLNSLHNHDPK